jgi:hypothetical protein
MTKEVIIYLEGRTYEASLKEVEAGRSLVDDERERLTFPADEIEIEEYLRERCGSCVRQHSDDCGCDFCSDRRSQEWWDD